MATAEAKPEARVYSDLADLVKKEAVAINSGTERAYRVGKKFVVTYSRSSAALAIVRPETVTQKELLAAALEAANGKPEEKAPY